jgi:hypothetical protein
VAKRKLSISRLLVKGLPVGMDTHRKYTRCQSNVPTIPTFVCGIRFFEL